MLDQAAMTQREPFLPAFLSAIKALATATGERQTDLKLSRLLDTTPGTILRWRLGHNEPEPFKADAMLRKLRAAANRKRPPA